jgi:hypothetical protein
MEFFEEQYKEINSNLTEYMGKAMIKASVFNTSYWEKRLADKARPLISATMGDAARQILDMTGQSYDPNQPVVRAILGQRVNQFSHFVNETTDKKIKYKIEQALQDNIEGGIAAQRLAVKEVLSEYLLGKAAESRANLIAQTEAMAATNGGIMAGIDQSEEFERKMWLTSRDDRVRETHIPMDGVVVNYNEMFVLPDGQEMEYPQDYNERCVLMATDLPLKQREEPESFLPGERIEAPGFNAPLEPEPTVEPAIEQETSPKTALEKELINGDISSTSDLSSGCNKTQLTSNGVKGVFKPKSGEHADMRDSIPTGTFYKREVAAYKVDQILGFDLVPPTAERELYGEVGSHQLFMKDYKIANEALNDPGKWGAVKIETRSRLNLLDYFLGSEDRHGGNWMINNKGNIAAIDNGLSLGKYVSYFRTPFYDIDYMANITTREGVKDIWSNFTWSKVQALKTELYDSKLIDGESFNALLSRIKYYIEKGALPNGRGDVETITLYYKDILHIQGTSHGVRVAMNDLREVFIKAGKLGS